MARATRVRKNTAGDKAKGKKAAPQVEKAKIGRPSKFDGIDFEQVKMLALDGWDDKRMAAFFKVTEQTWTNWKKAHPDFFASLKDWKLIADREVEERLYKRAIGYSHPEDKIFNDGGEPLIVPTIKHYPPDTTAAIFWLKNRKPAEWRDKQELDLNVSDDIAEMLDARRKRAKAAKPG